MITLTIDNVLRVTRAHLSLPAGAIVGITGDNAQGKSSTAVAIGAALGREGNPFGAGRGKGGVYLHDGAESGGVSVVFGDPEHARVDWNARTGEFSQVGARIPACSAIALGLIDLTQQMLPTARTEMWQSQFMPDGAAIAEAIADQLHDDLPRATIADMVDQIRTSQSADETLNAICQDYKARATAAKRIWASTTGTAYGVAKAASWQPPGWTPDLDGKSDAEMDDAAVRAQAALDEARVSQAVSSADMERGKAAAAEMPALEARARDLEGQAKAARENLAQAKEVVITLSRQVDFIRSRIADLERSPPAGTLACPECGAALLLVEGALATADPDAVRAEQSQYENQLAELRETLADHKGRLDRAKTDASDARTQEQRATQDHMAAATQLHGVTEAARIYTSNQQPRAGGTDPDVVAARQAEADAAHERAKLVRQRSKAAREHGHVAHYTMIADITGPKGIRAQMLAPQVEELQAILRRISDITEWPLVRLQREYAIEVGGRTFLPACGQSELRKMQISLQLATAWVLGDPVIIIDRADELDTASRLMLFDLLRTIAKQERGATHIVCGTNMQMTALNPAGKNFTIEDGVLRSVEN